MWFGATPRLFWRPMPWNSQGWSIRFWSGVTCRPMCIPILNPCWKSVKHWEAWLLSIKEVWTWFLMEPSLKSAPMMVAREGRKAAKEVSCASMLSKDYEYSISSLQKKGALFCITFQDLLKSKTFLRLFCLLLHFCTTTIRNFFCAKIQKLFLLPAEHLVIGRTWGPFKGGKKRKYSAKIITAFSSVTRKAVK